MATRRVDVVIIATRSLVIPPLACAESAEAIAQVACARDLELDLTTVIELAATCLVQLADRPTATASELADLCLGSDDKVNIAFIVQVARAAVAIAGTTDLSEPITD